MKLLSVLTTLYFLFAGNLVLAENTYLPGQVFVKFKKDSIRLNSTMTQLYQKLDVDEVIYFSDRFKGLELLSFNSVLNVEKVVSYLESLSIVEYAHPNYVISVPETFLHEDTAAVSRLEYPCLPGLKFPGCSPDLCWNAAIILPPIPEGCRRWGVPYRPDLDAPPEEVIPPVADPDLGNLYGLEKVQAQKVWNQLGHEGSKDFIVGVIDTGIDYNHEDLAFNMWRNQSPTEEQDVVGYNFIHNDGLPYDDQGHGTHTAGTIGAVGGNGVAIAGVSPRVSIMALKFLSAQGTGSLDGAIRAIDYAIANGARVLNNSWGYVGEPVEALAEAITRAEEAGILFVAAAGNGNWMGIGQDNDKGTSSDYPASYPHESIMSVAATNEKDKLTGFSNYGLKTVDLGAPGDSVLSAVPGNRYKKYSGTSMAAPHVAGAAALLWSKYPHWNAKKVKDVLLCSVDKVSALEGKMVAGGRLNVYRAMTAPECLNE